MRKNEGTTPDHRSLFQREHQNALDRTARFCYYSIIGIAPVAAASKFRRGLTVQLRAD